MSSVQDWSVATGLVASTSSDQSGGTPLPARINVVSTVGTVGDSMLLPRSRPGAVVCVKNAASNSLDVFPSPGEIINALSANAALAVAGAALTMFFCASPGTWYSK